MGTTLGMNMAQMLDRIRAQFDARRDSVAFVIGDVTHTYAALAARVGGIVKLLASEAPDVANVGILAADDLDTYAAILATWFAGKTMVPLNTTHPPDRNRRILEQAGIEVVLASSAPGELGTAPEVRFLRTNDVPAADPPPAPRPDPEHPAYILFTSGSTGIPKGVPIPHRALEGFLDAFEAFGLRLGPDDRFLQMFDLTFDLSLMAYCVPLTLGASAYTVPPDAIKSTYVYRLLDEYRITCALMVPSILARLRPFFGEIRLDALRASLFCGEALYEDLMREWSACVPAARLFNVYGPTEATIYCTVYELSRGAANKASNGIVCIGRAMKGVDILIADESGAPVPRGTKGELCLGGRQVTPGYWRNPERNAVAFFTHGGATWYRTGDLCSMDAEGDMMYHGRVDHQVKVQGFRVELAEIEHHVRELTGAKHVAAVAAPNANGETAIYLFLEGYDAVPRLLEGLKARVPPYMIPTSTRCLEALPLNANGKIDRPALVASLART